MSQYTSKQKAELVVQYEPLINKLTAQFFHKVQYNWDDLKSYAYEGFALALNKYDSERSEMSFMSFAAYEMRNNIMGYKLPNGKWVNVIAEGRLVNIAAADGHPAEIMDMSFAVQALGALYIRENHEKLGNHLINIPEEMDNIIASRKLAAWGIEIDTLTAEQEKYLNSWQI